MSLRRFHASFAVLVCRSAEHVHALRASESPEALLTNHDTVPGPTVPPQQCSIGGQFNRWFGTPLASNYCTLNPLLLINFLAWLHLEVIDEIRSSRLTALSGKASSVVGGGSGPLPASHCAPQHNYAYVPEARAD